MKTEVETISINGVEYVKKGCEQKLAEKVDGMDYVIIRTYSAGVFAGYLKRRDGKEVDLVNARRLWYWSGACSLSQLAIDGTAKPSECKFAIPFSVTLTEAIEIIPVTEKAKNSIEGVLQWKQ